MVTTTKTKNLNINASPTNTSLKIKTGYMDTRCHRNLGASSSNNNFTV